MTWRIAVLGGSSPFTASLIDALARQAPSLPPFTLALHGRNADNLAAIAGYAARRLAGPPTWSTDMAAVLDGADVVIHQIRYGGLELRGEGETLCESLGLAADETLGPAALVTAMSIRDGVAATADAIAEHCPAAWVLNLTNPLSCVTAWMGERVERVVGLCELPLHTLHLAAAALDIPVDRIAFRYAGFNHRGFFHRLRAGDDDLLASLAAQGAGVSVNGISGTAVGELGALPLKYFALHAGGWAPQQHRAQALSDLSAQIFRELRVEPSQTPPSLSRRDLSWYPMSVAPMLAALGSSEDSVQLCNLPGPDGLVVERFVRVSSAGMAPVDDGPRDLPPAVDAWLGRYARHERALLSAVASPCVATVEAALAADPCVPPGVAGVIAQDVLAHALRLRSRLAGRP